MIVGRPYNNTDGWMADGNLSLYITARTLRKWLRSAAIWSSANCGLCQCAFTDRLIYRWEGAMQKIWKWS